MKGCVLDQKAEFISFETDEKEVQAMAEKVEILDLRQMPPFQRHEKIFQTWDALKPGEALKIINDHDPKPLWYQFEVEYKDKYAWEIRTERPQGLDCKNKQEIRSALGAFYSAVPKQHGAWIVLIACFIIGSCAGVRFGLESVILLVSVIAAFLARAALGLGLSLPGEEKERKGLIAWVMFYSGMLLVSGIWLVAGYKLWILGLMGIIGLGLAAFSLVLEKVKKDMTLSGQIINIIGLSLTAPAAEYCASGSYSPNTLGVWLVCVLFSGKRILCALSGEKAP